MNLHLAYLADGHNYHVRKWIRALCEAGMRITLITFRPPAEEIPGLTVVQLPIRFGDAERYSYLNFLVSQRRVRRIVRALKPDVLFGSYATHYGWMAARTGYHPFVLQTWTFDLTKYPFEGTKRYVLNPIVRYTLGSADAITTDGPALASTARTLYPDHSEKFTSVRWGIRIDGFDLTPDRRRTWREANGIDTESLVVCSPRGLLPVYRPAETLEALSRLLSTTSNVHVVVLTLAHERSPLASGLLAKLEDTGRATIIDRFVSTEEMHSIWNATDIVVSIPVSDGISESLLEATYAGAWPIVSDIPSNRSLVEDGLGATVVSEPVAETLLEALQEQTKPRLLERQRELARHNSRWILENATVDKTADQLVRLFESLART